MCKVSRFIVEGERFMVSSWSISKRLELNEDEEEEEKRSIHSQLQTDGFNVRLRWVASHSPLHGGCQIQGHLGYQDTHGRASVRFCFLGSGSRSGGVGGGGGTQNFQLMISACGFDGQL